MYYSTDFLVCISIAPRNNICGAREFSVNFLNSFREFSVNWAYFQKHPVKSRIFLRKLGWSLDMLHLMPATQTTNAKLVSNVPK